MEVPHDDSKIGLRNKRGDWVPNAKAPITPLYWFPFQPLKFLKHIFLWNGLLLNFYHLLWGALAVFCWFFLTPSMETLKTIQLDWIAFLFVRNSIRFIYMFKARLCKADKSQNKTVSTS